MERVGLNRVIPKIKEKDKENETPRLGGPARGLRVSQTHNQHLARPQALLTRTLKAPSLSDSQPARRPPSDSSNEKTPSLSDSESLRLAGQELVPLKRVPREMRQPGYWAAGRVEEREQAEQRAQADWEQAELLPAYIPVLPDDPAEIGVCWECGAPGATTIMSLGVGYFCSLECRDEWHDRVSPTAAPWQGARLAPAPASPVPEVPADSTVGRLRTRTRLWQEHQQVEVVSLNNKIDQPPINKAEEPIDGPLLRILASTTNGTKQGEDQKEEAQKKKQQKTAVSGRQQNFLPEDSSSD